MSWSTSFVRRRRPDLKIGLCLEPHDLAASKLAAGREKDWIFVTEMMARNIVQPDVLLQRVSSLPISDDRRDRLLAWVKARAPGA